MELQEVETLQASPENTLAQTGDEDAETRLASLRAARHALRAQLDRSQQNAAAAAPDLQALQLSDSEDAQPDPQTSLPDQDMDRRPVQNVVTPHPKASQASEADIPPSTFTDLHALPGIGPSLVGLLQSAGIMSLKDMAAADADALAREMGLIGQLLDLDHWIAFSVAAIAAQQVAPVRFSSAR